MPNLVCPLSPTSLLAVASLLGGAVAQERNSSGGPLLPDQACYDVSSYALTLKVDPAHRTIAGTLRMTAKVTKTTSGIRLDLDDALAVRSVRSGEEKLRFEHKAGRIHIQLALALDEGQRIDLVVEYGGSPRVAPLPPWEGGFTWTEKTPAGAPWITTSCQGTGADLWWPCKDHPSDKAERFDLEVTVPEKLFCASNGRLVGDTVDDTGWRTLHWRVSTPINNYCIALNIAPYEILERDYRSVTGETFKAFFYCLPESRKKAEEAFPHFLDHLRHMEELCGPYPFRRDKYGIVETPYLGMEHQTIIAYGNEFKLGPRGYPDGYDWLHHHEMAHEWWANLVTCRDWKDMWVHEGIGTYMQALYLEKVSGAKAYHREMLIKGRHLNRHPIAPLESMDSHGIYFAGANLDIYNKGAWVMHTLRWLLGDEKFFVALRRMAYPDPAMEKVTDGSCTRFTDTEEIRKIAEEHGGMDLAWFFAVYLRQPRVPRLIQHLDGGKLHLEWEVPIDVVFPMPVAVRINGKTTRVEMKDGKGAIDAGPGDEIEIDPEHWILKRSTRRKRE